MSREETSAYVKHHMEEAKRTRPVFAESAVQMLYTVSPGVPRVVNQICSQALFEAENTDAEIIEEAQIGRVLADMDR